MIMTKSTTMVMIMMIRAFEHRHVPPSVKSEMPSVAAVSLVRHPHPYHHHHHPDIDKSLDLEKFSKRNDSDFSLSLARS